MFSPEDEILSFFRSYFMATKRAYKLRILSLVVMFWFFIFGIWVLRVLWFHLVHICLIYEIIVWILMVFFSWILERGTRIDGVGVLICSMKNQIRWFCLLGVLFVRWSWLFELLWFFWCSLERRVRFFFVGLDFWLV